MHRHHFRLAGVQYCEPYKNITSFQATHGSRTILHHQHTLGCVAVPCSEGGTMYSLSESDLGISLAILYCHCLGVAHDGKQK